LHPLQKCDQLFELLIAQPLHNDDRFEHANVIGQLILGRIHARFLAIPQPFVPPLATKRFRAATYCVSTGRATGWA
jgi:hypothetical protein